MRKKQVEALIRYARKAVSKTIAGHAANSQIAGALASEGYNGGYRDCLDDMVLLLNDVVPTRFYWWPEMKD